MDHKLKCSKTLTYIYQHSHTHTLIRIDFIALKQNVTHNQSKIFLINSQ